MCSAKIPAQGAVANHAAEYVQAVGITQDSGINERSKALYALTISKSEVDGTDFKRRVQISIPVPIPPFNPWRGYAMPASCPYTKTRIPHLSSRTLRPPSFDDSVMLLPEETMLRKPELTQKLHLLRSLLWKILCRLS